MDDMQGISKTISSLPSKLTLNLGLRYDLFKPTVDAHNIKTWFDPKQRIPISALKVYSLMPQTTARALDHLTRMVGARVSGLPIA